MLTVWDGRTHCRVADTLGRRRCSLAGDRESRETAVYDLTEAAFRGTLLVHQNDVILFIELFPHEGEMDYTMSCGRMFSSETVVIASVVTNEAGKF